MAEKKRCCPQCKSEELQEEQLSLKGSAWPVMFGGTLFKKTELIAYACNRCAHVFLYLGDRVEEAGDTH